MVISKGEIMQAIRDALAERTDDDTIALIENISDTLDAGAEGAEWKTKYEENDLAWRNRYKNRFFGKEEEVEDEIRDDDGEKKLTYEALFGEKE